MPNASHARAGIRGSGMQWPPFLLTFESSQTFLLPCAPSHSHAQCFSCTGGHQGDWDAVAAIAAAHPCVIPSFGLHPWYIHSRSPQWLQHLEERLSAHPHAAMGEAGLHRTRKASSSSSGSRGSAMEEQVEVMCQQLKLACRLHRPIALHCVQAYGHMLTALQQHGPFPAGVILHSFNGPPDMLPALVSLNAYFSFSRLSASSAPHKLAHLLHQVPLDRLLLETDSPDGLPPARHKGEEGSTGRGGGEDGKAGRGGGEGCRESHSEARQREERGGGERGGVEGKRGEERHEERGEERGERGSGGPQEEGEGGAEDSGDGAALNTPATIGLVCEMVASSMGRSKEEVADAAFANAVQLFSFLGSRLPSFETPTKE
ncbi:unnamed protein product [Closterium sp. NIES-54]